MRRVGPGDRGQFVLLAGVVVALALAAMLTAYVQLGYHGGAGADRVERPVTDGRLFLERATHESARQVRGEFAWGRRGRAVTDVRTQLRGRLDELERSRVAGGVAYGATFNQTVAARRARADCPAGTARDFGPCEADRGVVVQERDGRTLVLAVAYDLRVTTPESETSLTTVVNATG